ncbi:MAG: class F sortase [Nocardioides sp.]
MTPRARTAAAAVALVLAISVLSFAPARSAAVPADRSAESTSSAQRGCAAAGKKFRPTALGIPGLSPRRTVLALGRDSRNVPKAPPLSESGKRQYAWDAKDKIKAGARHGVAKLNAHTYPDGSAIGNDLIRELYEGNRLVLRGRNGQQRCYDVIARVQIPAERRFARYYRTGGPHRVAIAVCSGVRRGPGDWSHRTIWFAKLID